MNGVCLVVAFPMFLKLFKISLEVFVCFVPSNCANSCNIFDVETDLGTAFGSGFTSLVEAMTAAAFICSSARDEFAAIAFAFDFGEVALLFRGFVVVFAALTFFDDVLADSTF